MARRITSGIHGLDKYIEGGFLHNSVNIVTGETGTGKTIFALQFIWHGLQAGDRCVYITLEERPEDIREDALVFGWDLAKYEKKGQLKLIYHDPAQANTIGPVLMNEVGKLKAKRLVIDSSSVLGMVLQNDATIRRRLFTLVSTLKKNECTTLLVSEIPEGSKKLSRFGVEEYVVDTVIVLNYLGIGETVSRSLVVRKMRRTSHGKDVYPFDINIKKGIVLKRPEV